MKAHELKVSFDKCKTSKQQLDWILAHKNKGIMLTLDNDSTLVEFGLNDEGDDVVYSSLNEYIGNSYGVIALLESLGIRSERC